MVFPEMLAEAKQKYLAQMVDYKEVKIPAYEKAHLEYLNSLTAYCKGRYARN